MTLRRPALFANAKNKNGLALKSGTEEKKMRRKPELIVMLTYNDVTVENASEIFRQCRNSKARYWGFKEKGIPIVEMKQLFAEMKQCGKITGLEVVAYTEQEGMDGARTALECGVDILMGTIYSDKINDFCKEHHLKYMPFVGTVEERPSVLKGDIQKIKEEARTYLEKGVYGIDLLGYRYTGDARQLNRVMAESIEMPICIAGSVDSYEKIDEILEIGAHSFTIGSAFFDNQFGETFMEQIDRVCDYVEKKYVS